jgi:DNA primase
MKNNYNVLTIKKIPILNIISDFNLGKTKRLNSDILFERCPFCSHHWHFQINPTKNLFSSFSGCVKGGDIVSFVMLTQNLQFKEAMKYIADKFNINDKTYSQHNNRLPNIEIFEELRIQKEINEFFDYCKIFELDEIFDKAYRITDKIKLLQYIYYCELTGKYIR